MKFGVLLLGLAAQLVGFLYFCKGFFPTKVLLTENEVKQWQNVLPDNYVEPEAKFNKVILMVVDAMRADFLFSNTSEMHFSHQLLNDGFGVGFTAFSNPPTVTLPRLKGITTGSTPNFIDAVLNIAEDDTSSTLGDQDSWIKQMAVSGWKINMFGDDTWLKLFPNYFHKTDGTASFYVSDFTIVDNNVTRHLDEELASHNEWDCMILHYLGLDHIGHKGGASSLNMPGKQAEMDSIIEKIFNEVVKGHPETLFVVMGDHGMNDVGNHGGSSIGETSAAMMFVSEQFQNLNLNNNIKAPVPWDPDFNYFTKIDQIDLVPTLTELLGLKVPINNLGNFVPSFLKLYETEKDKKNILMKNALQLNVLLNKSKGAIEPVPSLNIDATLAFIKGAKKELSMFSSNYNYNEILFGLLIYFIVTLFSFVLLALHFKGKFYVAFFDVVFFFTYAVNFIASSFVEEEHHLWWFFTTIFLIYLSFKAIKRNRWNLLPILILFICLRILKAWNTSGQKYNIKSNLKFSSYISELSSNTGPIVYSALLIFTFLPIFITIDMHQGTLYHNILKVLCTSIFILLVNSKFLSYLSSCFDLNSTNLDLPQWCHSFINFLHSLTQKEDYNAINNFLFGIIQKLWFVIFIMNLFHPLFLKFVLKKSNSEPYFLNILSISTLMLISQTSYYNVPIFGILYFVHYGFKHIAPSSVNSNTFNLFIIMMQNLTFFLFGSTNSISTVDLTNSFNGLTSYNMIFSGILTYVCNWAGPLFWTFASMELTMGSLEAATSQKLKWKILYDKLIFNFVFYSVSGLMLLICCYHLRFHLFIWTVFSPKILYFLSWLICNIIFDTFFCIVVTLFYV